MGTRRSRHNKGRKPIYKEHRLHLEPANVILDQGSKYLTGSRFGFLRWTPQEEAAVFTLCGANSNIEICADVLGRWPRAIAQRATDNRLSMSREWWSQLLSPTQMAKRQDVLARRAERHRLRDVLIAEKRAARMDAVLRGRTAYPFVAEEKPETVDLLEVNDLVPKGLPEWIRADICQNIMLALLEKETTLTELKANRASANFFVRKFYREEGDHRLVSLESDDDTQAYDEIAGAMARDEWGWTEVNNRREAYDLLGTFAQADQIGAVYQAEIRRAHRKAHDAGIHLSYRETKEGMDAA